MEPNKPWPDQGKIQDPRGKKNGLKSTALRERKATIFHSHTKGERYVHWLCKKDEQADAASWTSFSLSKPCQVAPIIAAMLIDADKKNYRGFLRSLISNLRSKLTSEIIWEAATASEVKCNIHMYNRVIEVT